MRQIYLDYNATTPVAPCVVKAMLPFFSDYAGNPSSAHSTGRGAREALETARGQVASLIGADVEEVVFTSGGTESNNLALLGNAAARRDTPGHLVISGVEHPAITEPAKLLAEWGWELSVVPCDGQGVVSPDAVAAELRPNTRLVSVMLANNETGAIQPVAQIAERCRARNVAVHTDAAQAIGKLRTNVLELGVDLLTIAGHKAYAPKGVGALFVRRGLLLEPHLRGADQEFGLRPGTENVPGAVALGQACQLAEREMGDDADRMAMLRDRLQEQLLASVPELIVHSARADRLPNTLCVAFPDVTGADLLAAAPEINASTGSACHGAASVSPTLRAMDVPPPIAAGTVRLSAGRMTHEEEVDRGASLLIDAWERLTA